MIDGMQLFAMAALRRQADSRGRALALEVGLDGLVLGVEVGHVDDQIPDDEHVRQRRDLARLAGVPLHLPGSRYRRI